MKTKRMQPYRHDTRHSITTQTKKYHNINKLRIAKTEVYLPNITRLA